MARKKVKVWIIITTLLLAGITTASFWPQQDQLLSQWVFLYPSGKMTFGETYSLMPGSDQKFPKSVCLNTETYNVPCQPKGEGLLVDDWFGQCAIMASYQSSPGIYKILYIYLSGINQPSIEVRLHSETKDKFHFHPTKNLITWTPGKTEEEAELKLDSPEEVRYWAPNLRHNSENAALSDSGKKKALLWLDQQISRFENKLGGIKIPRNCNLVKEHFHKK